ncbi:hypothetical protein D3C72_1899320 [compost metagenome]
MTSGPGWAVFITRAMMAGFIDMPTRPVTTSRATLMVLSCAKTANSARLILRMTMPQTMMTVV